MALHHPRAALLVLSTLLGIFGFLQAYKPLIPLDQLTVEEAFLERHLVDEQLLNAKPPNITAEQRAILDNVYFYTFFGPLKPNDPLPSSLRQQMTEFRQAFKNWELPLKPGTIEYLLTRALGQIYLYEVMVRDVREAVNKDHKDQGNMEAVSRAFIAYRTLAKVYYEVQKKYDNSSSLVKTEDVKKLEVAIETARDAVLAMPRINKNRELVITGDGGQVPGGSSPKPRNKLFPLLKRPYFWDPTLVLAAAVGYHLLTGHLVPSSGDLYSLSTSNITHNVTSPAVAFFASEGLSHLWSILLLGGLVALIAWCLWYCIKTDGEDEASNVSKQSSQKSQELSSTKSTSSST